MGTEGYVRRFWCHGGGLTYAADVGFIYQGRSLRGVRRGLWAFGYVARSLAYGIYVMLCAC